LLSDLRHLKRYLLGEVLLVGGMVVVAVIKRKHYKL